MSKVTNDRDFILDEHTPKEDVASVHLRLRWCYNENHASLFNEFDFQKMHGLVSQLSTDMSQLTALRPPDIASSIEALLSKRCSRTDYSPSVSGLMHWPENLLQDLDNQPLPVLNLVVTFSSRKLMLSEDLPKSTLLH